MNNQDKPLLYLDQNLLGSPLEALIADTEKLSQWRNNLYISFSDETLKEIIRSGGLADRFLNNLCKFETVHLRHELDENRKLTGRIIGRLVSPRERYTELLENPISFDETRLMHKFYGGQKDKTLSEVMNEQTETALQNVYKSVKELEALCNEEGITFDTSSLDLESLHTTSQLLSIKQTKQIDACLLYTSPSPRD